MGCVFSTPLSVSESVQCLKRVEHVIQMNIDKNHTAVEEKTRELKATLKSQSKESNLQKLRGIKLMEKQIIQYMKRLNAVVEKRLQLESLHVTYQHIEAVKMTSYTFKKYLKANDIEKIEALHESITDMIQNAIDIQDTLAEEHIPLVEDDLEAELNQMINRKDDRSDHKDAIATLETPFELADNLEPAPTHLPEDQTHLLSYNS